MERCPFPVIPEYLRCQNWPEAAISDVKVTHIWTQSHSASCSIAEASLIKNVCLEADEMIGKIDGLLLARDDAENHLNNCMQFLEAGIPVYIDKPIALSLGQLAKIRAHQRFENQIFSCSALKFAKELVFSEEDLQDAGEMKGVYCYVPRSWDKYIIHGLEPLFEQFSGLRPEKISTSKNDNGSTSVNVIFKGGLNGCFIATNCDNTPITIGINGSQKTIQKSFSDSFSSFRAALSAFVTSIRTGENLMDWDSVQAMVKIIGEGNIKCPR